MLSHVLDDYMDLIDHDSRHLDYPPKEKVQQFFINSNSWEKK
jgi:hypothetical protein